MGKEDNRPFFSIIIACFNPKNYLGGLLGSIVRQYLQDEIEVILSDDCSTEDYSDIVEKYRPLLNIKEIKTDYNFAPGNTREKGLEIATGKWITFIDQDDILIDDVLTLVKNIIEKEKEEYYVITDFIEVEASSMRVIREYKRPSGWNHGKFYNLDNLWRNCDIHFKKDLFSHEDIYISSTINCCLRHLNIKPLFIDLTTYVWVLNPKSLTHIKYKKLGNDHTYFEALFKDYLESTAGVYIDRYENGFIDKDFAKQELIEVLGYTYFYIQSFIFHQPETYIRENLDICRELLVKIKELFNLNNEDIWNALAVKEGALFKAIEASASIGAGSYIPKQTLEGYLNYLHKDIKLR